MKKLLIVLFLSLPIFAGNLVLSSGVINAHTEQMMDSTINPFSEKLEAQLSIDGSDITTLSGKFWVEMKSFISDNADRDEHMYETIKSEENVLATFNIISVVQTKEADVYQIDGTLDFHGKKNQLMAKAKIIYANATLNFDADSMIKMSDYGVEMPCMVFMCVRDQVDLKIKATLKD